MSFRPLFPLLLLCSLPLTAATFTVTSTGDSGPGTLRQAILNANANPGRDQIVVQTDWETSESPLPPITGPVDITGARTPSGRYTITKDTEDVGVFHFEAGAAGSTIRSLAFVGSGNVIFIDTADVTVANIVNSGDTQIWVRGEDNIIGGAAAADANDIVNLVIEGARTRVLGNEIEHFELWGAVDTVVGMPGAGNDIGHLWVRFSSSGTVVEGNTIVHLTLQNTAGPPVFVTGNDFGNTPDFGVQVIGTATAEIRDNTFTTTQGVFVNGADGVAIIGNRFLGSGRSILLRDTDQNDPPPDADTGSNEGQNHPLIAFARLTPELLYVEGTLASAPLTPYEIEVYAGGVALGTTMVTTDATGNAAFAISADDPSVAPGAPITATATNRALVATPGNAPNSTSEMSPAAGVVVQPGLLGFDPVAYSVDEGAGTVTVTVRRTSGSDGTVTVGFETSDNTATAPGDYTATSGTLTFGPGVVEQTFTIPITVDAVPETRETFTVTLSDATGGAAIGAGTATIAITDAALAATQVPTLSEWAMIALAMGLAAVALLRRV